MNEPEAMARSALRTRIGEWLAEQPHTWVAPYKPDGAPNTDGSPDLLAVVAGQALAIVVEDVGESAQRSGSTVWPLHEAGAITLIPESIGHVKQAYKRIMRNVLPCARCGSSTRLRDGVCRSCEPDERTRAAYEPRGVWAVG